MDSNVRGVCLSTAPTLFMFTLNHPIANPESLESLSNHPSVGQENKATRGVAKCTRCALSNGIEDNHNPSTRQLDP